MKRQNIRGAFRFLVVGALTIFTVSQIVVSFVDLLDSFGSNRLIQLTFVEPENNLEIRQHPYYTVCPIFENSANLSSPSATLLTTIIENTRAFPMALYLELFNSKALAAEHFSTWVKMKDSYRDRRETLIHCTTFSIPTEIKLGQNEAKVNLILHGKDPTDSTSEHESIVKEFRIYIHENLGYINTFMLSGGGHPHIVVPGYDKRLGLVKPQLSRHIIKKRKRENYLDTNALTCDPSPPNDCFEQHLQFQLGNCRIPWRLPTDQNPPCPPCDWGQDLSKAACIDMRQELDAIDLKTLLQNFPRVCNILDGFLHCSSDVKRVCAVCDNNCSPFLHDSFCTDREALEKVLSSMPVPADKNVLHEFSTSYSGGCKLPCSYFEYEAVEVEATSTRHKLAPSDQSVTLMLELSTGDVETVVEVEAKSLWDFMGNIAGNLGMIFGTSIYSLQFPSIASYNSLAEWETKQEIAQVVMLSAAFTWTITNYFKYNENRIRQEVQYQETNMKAEAPFITLCPAFEDRMLLPATGFENKELTFEKYTLMLERNFLLKDYPYKGTWGTKWKYYKHNIYQSQMFGQQCYTYTPRQDESNEIVIELNRKGIEDLQGYIHEYDNLQYAFMHKSSSSKFSIPFNNPLYEGMPNQYRFKVTSKYVYENQNKDCILPDEDGEEQTVDCYVGYLEKNVLGCHLPWERSTSQSYHDCQLPFRYKNKEYTSCTNIDAADSFFWCPTAVTRDRVALEYAWKFCNENYMNSSSNSHATATCKSREKLELLAEEFLDLSRTNPRLIAEDLLKFGCPFYCHYKEYRSELMLKKQVDSMEDDHLQLIFEIDEGYGQQAENVEKDLDYSVDMFVSDLGNGFGFLLGLSLIGVIKIWINSVALFLRAIFIVPAQNQQSQAQKRKWLPHVKSIFLILKWTLVTGFVTILTISCIAKDFSDLVAFQRLNSKTGPIELSESEFLNLDVDSEELILGISSNLVNNNSCPHAIVTFDGFCDDKANIPECQFDGGDCCRQGSSLKPNSHWFCTDCKCHSGDLQDKNLGVLKPGLCEFCVFPFLEHNPKAYVFNSDNDLRYDCILGKTGYYCPTAIHKESLLPYGIPYLWPCTKGEHQLQPSCYESPNNEWICNKTLVPWTANASSIFINENIARSLLSPAEFAIDTNLQLVEVEDHGLHTYQDRTFVSDPEHYPWLQLDFDTVVTVYRVAVTNRFDENGNRFQNLTVSVGFIPPKANELSENPICDTYTGPSYMSTSIVMKCEEPLSGTIVVVQQAQPLMKHILSIREVYVCGS